MNKMEKSLRKKYPDVVTGKLTYECNISKKQAEKYALNFATFWKCQLIRYEHRGNCVTCYISKSFRIQIENLKEGIPIFLNIKDTAGNIVAEKSCIGLIENPQIVFMSGDACVRASFNGQSDFYSLQELSFTQKGDDA